MSGIVLSVIPPTTFSFSGAQASAIMVVPIASRIDLSGFETGALQVRLHTNSSVAQADTIAINVFPDGYTPDDPGTPWDTLAANAIQSVNFSGPAPGPPLYQAAALIAPFPNLARINLVCTKAGVTGTSIWRLSIDLMLRTGDDAGPMLPRSPGAYVGYLPAGLAQGQRRAGPGGALPVAGPPVLPASPRLPPNATGMATPNPKPGCNC